MADTRLTPISLARKIVLCFQVIFTPRRMVAAEQKNNEVRKTLPPAGEMPHRAYIVRRAFWSALVLVMAAILVGIVVGALLRRFVGSPIPKFVTCLQIAGAALLLWGTLFVRGWDIQTIGGVTLTERVNHWIYRFLYFLGTALLTLSVAW